MVGDSSTGPGHSSAIRISSALGAARFFFLFFRGAGRWVPATEEGSRESARAPRLQAAAAGAPLASMRGCTCRTAPAKREPQSREKRSEDLCMQRGIEAMCKGDSGHRRTLCLRVFSQTHNPTQASNTHSAHTSTHIQVLRFCERYRMRQRVHTHKA